MNAVFEFIRNIFAVPFGYVLGFFYDFTGSYLLAIFLLTLLVKLCFLPFRLNQQKSTLERARHSLAIKKIKMQHVNDETTSNQEVETYKANNVKKKKNMGCLVFIIELVVFIGLIGVIYSPLSNALHLPEDTITEMQTVMSESIDVAEDSNMFELQLLKETSNYQNELVTQGALSDGQVVEILAFKENYTFLGEDLSESPQLTQINVLWLIPLAVLVIGIVSRLVVLLRKKKYDPGTGKFTALEAFPFISALIMCLFTFMFPAGVGFYWMINNLLSFIEQTLLTTIYNPTSILIESYQLQLQIDQCKREANLQLIDKVEPQEQQDNA